jgi:hypothetical protein
VRHTGTDNLKGQPVDGRGPARPRRNTRPRDELGRPLPYGSVGFEPPPLELPVTAADTLALAQELLDAGLPFHAHEVFEDAWRAAPDTERELWRALAQLAVGVTHIARGNRLGAVALLRRAAVRLTPYRVDPPHRIDVDSLLGWIEQTMRDPDDQGELDALRLCALPPKDG